MTATMPEVQNIRPSTLEKYRAIHKRFKHLYDVERKRIDDVERQLCAEFFLGSHRLRLILKMDLPQN